MHVLQGTEVLQTVYDSNKHQDGGIDYGGFFGAGMGIMMLVTASLEQLLKNRH